MSAYPPVKIGLLGLGTVGGGVTRVLARNAEEISRRAGREIAITHAAARTRDDHHLPTEILRHQYTPWPPLTSIVSPARNDANGEAR